MRFQIVLATLSSHCDHDSPEDVRTRVVVPTVLVVYVRSDVEESTPVDGTPEDNVVVLLITTWIEFVLCNVVSLLKLIPKEF